MKIKDWEKEIEALDFDNKKRMSDAIKTLMFWKTFADEYGWTGLTTLKMMLHDSIQKEKEKSSLYYKCDEVESIRIMPM